MSEDIQDVIIAGAGPAGCALALSLARCAPELSVIVVSDAEPSTFKIGESLPPEARRILHHIHPSLPKVLALQEQENIHISNDGTASVWGSEEQEERHAIMNPYGHGWHLDRATFDESLRQAVRDMCGVDSIKAGQLVKIQKQLNGLWISQVTNSETCISYQARWIIDATGRKASIANKIGARTIRNDDLLAFYTVFSSRSLEDDYDARTLIESTSTGWWYTSLLSEHRRVVVYHTDATSPTAKVSRRLQGFIELLHETTSHISSIVQDYAYEPISTPRNNFPQCTAAGSSSLSPPGDEEAQWYAVGDAAMAFDPLSAQGIMTALEMGFFLGRILGARLTGRAVADIANLESLGTVADVFERIKSEYASKRAYYYGTEQRFDTEFWRKRRTL